MTCLFIKYPKPTGTPSQTELTHTNKGDIIMPQDLFSIWESALSHRRRSDTGRRRVGLQSVTPNSCRQTTAAPRCCYWPDGQTETL